MRPPRKKARLSKPFKNEVSGLGGSASTREAGANLIPPVTQLGATADPCSHSWAHKTNLTTLVAEQKGQKYKDRFKTDEKGNMYCEGEQITCEACRPTCDQVMNLRPRHDFE